MDKKEDIFKLSTGMPIGDTPINDIFNHPDTIVRKDANGALHLTRYIDNAVVTCRYIPLKTRKAPAHKSSESCEMTSFLQLNDKDRYAQVMCLREKGYKQKEIAEYFGISQGLVSIIVNSNRS